MVTLANGSQTIAKGIGSSCPLPSLPLTFVLYVLDSPFNLISISKLTHDLNCLITFLITLSHCMNGVRGGRLVKDMSHMASFFSARLHLLLLALPWILLSLFTTASVIQPFPSFRNWVLVFLVCPQLSASHVSLRNILVSHSLGT